MVGQSRNNERRLSLHNELISKVNEEIGLREECFQLVAKE